MSKELETLERIKREATTPYFSALYDIDMWKKDFQTIEITLKALEIIKEHKLLNYVLKNKKCASMYHLSEEDCDLLKKVML